MKLITKQIEKRFNKIGPQDNKKLDEIIIVCKLFDPCGSATWYLASMDENRIAFGYVTGLYQDEWGYVSINELEEIRRPMGLTIERDIWFQECKFKDIVG